ncbi:hypothetical protein GCM10009759_55560 [Kitasatospora saccharophila]|uniref:Polyketide cyclase/dehydrase/lipid transport protein n=1 Tax=Kitasatospora saccharophila TaxID=407973 RepID=A0ABN0CGG6_9ACTN
MSQPTRSNSPFAGPDPATVPTVARPTTPILAIMAGLQRLYDQVAIPGVLLHEAVLSADGLSVELRVSGIAALSSWYDAHPRSSVSMGSRPGPGETEEVRGGLYWLLSLGQVTDGVRAYATTVTAEFEVLPDTALVRALCPWEARLRAVQAREIAAHAAKPGVAA